MERKFEIEQMSDCRWFYNFKDKTKNGETLTIEINKVTNPGGKIHYLICGINTNLLTEY